MANFPGPYEVRVFYTTNEPVQIAEHVCRLSLRLVSMPQPNENFTNITTLNKQGNSGITLFQAVSDFVGIFRSYYAPPVDISRVELWYYPPQTFDAVFVSAMQLGVQGNSGSSTQIASQTILTFRSSAGGIMKLDMRGTVLAAAIKQSFPFGHALSNTMANHVLNPDTPWIARDGGYPVSPIYLLPGQNERAWKRVYR